jgi:alpha-tubulin suppressor-like RCC1 family protein
MTFDITRRYVDAVRPTRVKPLDFNKQKQGDDGGSPETSPSLSREASSDQRALTIVSVVCGAKHCLALTRSGHVFSWGCNRFGQLGLQRSTSEFADFESRGEPTRVLGKLAAMVATTEYVDANATTTTNDDGGAAEFSGRCE